jgi:ferredoxin
VVRFRAHPGEFILDAALRNGIVLPSLCRQGWCTRCAVRLVSGDVDQSASRRFFDADRVAGFALACTARPRSAVRAVAGQHDAIRAHRVAAGLPVPRG